MSEPIPEFIKTAASITRGNGSYTIVVEGYEQAPADIQKKMVEEYRAARAEGGK